MSPMSWAHRTRAYPRSTAESRGGGPLSRRLLPAAILPLAGYKPDRLARAPDGTGAAGGAPLGGSCETTGETPSVDPVQRSKLDCAGPAANSFGLKSVLTPTRDQRGEVTHSQANGIDCGASRFARGLRGEGFLIRCNPFRVKSGRALATVGPTGVAVQDALWLHQRRPSVSEAIWAQPPSVATRIRLFHHQTADPTQRVELVSHNRLLPDREDQTRPDQGGAARPAAGPSGSRWRALRPGLLCAPRGLQARRRA